MNSRPSLFALLCLFLVASIPQLSASDESKASIYDYGATTIEGQQIDLSRFKGSVLLIVNTASRCGFTPQYKELEELYRTYKDRNFAVLGFPSNDFANQEPGTDSEIREFCAHTFGVTFPMMCKQSVTGSAKQPIYAFLTENSPEEFQGEVGWNFEKFLIDRKGNVRGRYSSFTNPLSIRLREKIEELLLESP